MAASTISSSAVTSVTRASLASPFAGVKSPSTISLGRKLENGSRSSGFKVKCMQVWPPLGKRKFETLSYLPPLPVDALLKQIDYLIRSGWIPCIEFTVGEGFVYREHHHSPGYYDGRYWTMWKLPMYGCTDSTQVLAEVEANKKEYPNSYIRIIGFDNKRQVQCVSFIVHTPPSFHG
uniref:Ribulose bisphosphate carboxylase small subunit, chloroplastic n=1 Tax=Actinidia deliciosa TaxID=3627 RepID=A7YVW5_ACTDE|nr:RBCS1 [Actinidia deliciosa]